MRTTDQRDEGFTLIELLATMALMGVLLAMLVGPWRQYQGARAQQDTARLVVAAMRQAQVSAVAESTRFRVAVTDAGRSLTVYRAPVSGTEAVRRVVRISERSVSLTAPSFTTSAGASSSAYFYGRGTASAGSLKVSRKDDADVVVEVEGLTGRVSQ